MTLAILGLIALSLASIQEATTADARSDVTARMKGSNIAVSYTHLTLPTNREV